MMDETFEAVIDRIVDGQTAVILFEGDDERNQIELNAEELPAGAKEGGVVEITLSDGEVGSVTYLEEQTKSRRQRAQERFDHLSKRLPD